MKILHIAHANGGSVQGRFVAALAESQRRLGYEVHTVVQQMYGNQAGVSVLPEMTQQWELNLLRKQERQGFFDLYSTPLLTVLGKEEFLQADIVHLHDLQGGYFSYLLLPFLAAKPLVWTQYDERAFIESPLPEGGKASTFRSLVRNVQSLTECTIVATQPWLKERAQRSPLGQNVVKEIPVGVDAEYWQPSSKEEARKKLGLPRDVRVVLVDPQALRAVELLRKQGWVVLTLDQEQGQTYSFRSADLGDDGLRNLYQAIDLYLCFDSNQGLSKVIEAAACGVSVAVPQSSQWQYPWLVNGESGVVLSMQSQEALEQLKQMQGNPEILAQWGLEGRRKLLASPYALNKVASQYEQLYQRLVPGLNKTSSAPVAPAVASSEELLERLFKTHLDISRLQVVRSQGWPAVWEELKKKVEAFSKDEGAKRGAFVDAFLTYFITQDEETPIWGVVEQWLRLRNMPVRSGDVKDDERLAALFFAREMRELWKRFILKTPQAALAKMDVVRQSRMVTFWRLVFLNDASVLYLDEGRNETVLPIRYRSVPKEAYSGKAYPDLLIRSMYQPYGEAGVVVDMDVLLKSAVPLALKVIAPFWLSCAPYYNNDKIAQQAALRHIRNYCEAAVRHPQAMPKGLFDACSEHFTLHLWRLSYCGGNMVKEISAFGDFLHYYMKRFYSRWVSVKQKTRKKNKKLRIGYISSNFRNQAVSFYMANRILHADKENYEIVTISLERRCDELTEQIKQKSDQYIAITDFGNVDAIAQTIVDSQLDVLIYTDIGMDPLTYKLAALQLAPTQAVLVGHGVTTGLPTVQYYLSGDFESQESDSHYREKLIRLPRLGAAQFAPFEPEEGRTRKDFGLPDDKVLFVSCANGIKHGPARDDVLVRILQQAPNAVIALKPFMLPNLVDMHFVERLSKKVRAAGVADRFRILPPLPKNTDLLALLRVCDVNLDTYPYGGWTTNMDALYVGLPVVTQEGELARTRWGAGMLRAMGIQEGIAQNEDEYVAWAVRYASDAELRSRIRAQVEVKAKEVLFDGSGTQKEYEEVLLQMHAAHHASRKR
ncbi:hypothetical protein [Anaeromusa sp.]|uniref:O-linked N-acetylglucosamine transferase family protein n=1 Tax=Anaeromusa sp. TaxID=1872520 RepID=UPI002611C77D|nr:hypothetical protein [Anaeromusa sp.]MDD3158736.1 hypothetical protein [Anaeromusa sp.]